MGILTHSVALTADAIHSLTDLISDGITLFTVRFARKQPTELFPLGFGKLDTFGTLVSSGILAIGAFHIFKGIL